jgi:hypothetical protein
MRLIGGAGLIPNGACACAQLGDHVRVPEMDADNESGPSAKSFVIPTGSVAGEM